MNCIYCGDVLNLVHSINNGLYKYYFCRNYNICIVSYTLFMNGKLILLKEVGELYEPSKYSWFNKPISYTYNEKVHNVKYFDEIASSINDSRLLLLKDQKFEILSKTEFNKKIKKYEYNLLLS